jgi:hypothetical protein
VSLDGMTCAMDWGQKKNGQSQSKRSEVSQLRYLPEVSTCNNAAECQDIVIMELEATTTTTPSIASRRPLSTRTALMGTDDGNHHHRSFNVCRDRV